MDREDVPTARERRGALKIAATSVVGLTVFTQDVPGLIMHAGLWSVVSALRAAQTHVRVIDVDGTGLRSIVTAVTCLVLFLLFSLLNLDIRRRWPAVFVLLSMVGGSLAIDAFIGEPIIEELVTAHGYQRYPSGDHAVGFGRSRVWFEEFVATSC